jgi:hypothetical protein
VFENYFPTPNLNIFNTDQKTDFKQIFGYLLRAPLKVDTIM